MRIHHLKNDGTLQDGAMRFCERMKYSGHFAIVYDGDHLRHIVGSRIGSIRPETLVGVYDTSLPTYSFSQMVQDVVYSIAPFSAMRGGADGRRGN